MRNHANSQFAEPFSARFDDDHFDSRTPSQAAAIFAAHRFLSVATIAALPRRRTAR
jgi:hypothetical protein